MSALASLLSRLRDWPWEEIEASFQPLRARLELERLEEREAPALLVPANVQLPMIGRTDVVPSMSRLWLDRLGEIWREIQRGPRGVALVGDSILQNFQTTGASAWGKSLGSLSAADFAVGGITTSEALWLLRAGLLAHTKPQVVVIGLGTNNLLEGQTPASAAAGVRAVVAEVRRQLPTSKIVVVGALPLGELPSDALRRNAAEFNRLLVRWSVSAGFRFVDPGAAFVQQSGTLSKNLLLSDGIHPSPAGYDAYSVSLLSALSGLMRVR